MSDEMKDPKCMDGECDCEHCELLRKIGYASGRAFAEEFLQPIVTAIADTVSKQQKKAAEKRVAGIITPEEENKINEIIYTGMLNQLMHIAARIAHLNRSSIGHFVGNAAEHYEEGRPPMGKLIPIPMGIARELFESLMGGGMPNPFEPPPKPEGGTN